MKPAIIKRSALLLALVCVLALLGAPFFLWMLREREV